MSQTRRMSAKTVAEILTMLKEERDELLGAVEVYEQMLDEWADDEG